MNIKVKDKRCPKCKSRKVWRRLYKSRSKHYDCKGCGHYWIVHWKPKLKPKINYKQSGKEVGKAWIEYMQSLQSLGMNREIQSITSFAAGWNAAIMHCVDRTSGHV